MVCHTKILHGIAGQFLYIEPVDSDDAKLVSVYSVGGRLIKNSVKRPKASEGLEGGVYISGVYI